MTTLIAAIRSAIPPRLWGLMRPAWRRLYWGLKQTNRRPHSKRFALKLLQRVRGPVNLELGSGKRPGMESWLASDINGGGDIRIDFTKPLPFPDGSIDSIYSSHVLEHFSYPHPMLDFLGECRRVLKCGGTFRVAVPNARLYVEGYYDAGVFRKEAFCTYPVGLSYKSRIDYLNHIAYLGGEHKHLFDEEGLLAILNEVGFEACSLDSFTPPMDLAERRHESIYARAVKVQTGAAA